MTDQPTPECGPACVEQHTYRLDGCALCCVEMHGSVAQPAWAVPCPDRRCQAPADRPCLRSDGSPAGVCHEARFAALDRVRDATPPQDGPHAPQDGPEHPDAGAETPDGAGGRQTGAEPLARLHRLRDQLAAEHAKAVRADQQPRPDLDHLRVTAHNGIAAGLETAIFFVDHHLREVGEASSDTADSQPGEQYATRAAAIRDQSALAQIRLHIAAHRPRLQYADPILLGRLDAVLRQVGELEPAAGGEGRDVATPPAGIRRGGGASGFRQAARTSGGSSAALIPLRRAASMVL